MGSTSVTTPVPAKEKPGWMAIALIAVFVFTAIGLFFMGTALVKRSPGPDPAAVAVVPLSDVGAPPASEPFARTFTRQLDDAISKTDRLRLTPRSQAASLIMGTVQVSGDRVRAAIWLVRASDRRALWSKRYEFARKDAAGVPAEIVRGVVGALRLDSSAVPVR